MSSEYDTPQWRAYLRALAGLPLPTDEQLLAFVEHVCADYSLFKKLPLLPPGQPVRFWIDPNAGRDLHLGAGDGGHWMPRAGEGYSSALMHTATHIERFGYFNWEYARYMEYPATRVANEGQSFKRVNLPGLEADASAPLELNERDRVATLCRVPVPDLPPEVLKWGTATLTGAVDSKSQSPLCSYMGRLQQHLNNLPPNERVVPLNTPRIRRHLGDDSLWETPPPTFINWVEDMHGRQKAALYAQLEMLRHFLGRVMNNVKDF